MIKHYSATVVVILLVSTVCIGGVNGIPVIVGYKDAASAFNATLSPAHPAELIDPDIHAVAMDISKPEIPALQSDPGVRYVENDEIFSSGPGCHDIDLRAMTAAGSLKIPWNIRQIHADEVHARNITGRGVRVAVLDTGIDYTHPDLKGIYAGGYNYVSNTADPLDDQDHGTHCAGTLAATGKGIVGTAPGVSLYAVKVLKSDGRGNLSALIRGMYWARKNRINVESISIEYYFTSNALQESIEAAADQGILVIAAAGNFNFSHVSTIAASDRVISVGSVDQNNRRSSFSNRGKIDIAAPGNEIVSTMPGGGYQACNGTSMAAPHIAGVAALIMSEHPDWTAEQVKEQIVNTATSLGPAELYGAGLVNATNATLTNQ